MANNSIHGIGSDYPLPPSVKTGQPVAATPASGDFLATLQGQLADFKAQTMSVLISSLGSANASGTGSVNGTASVLDALLAQTSAIVSPQAIGGISPLFDPASSYRLMTEINRRDVIYRAEYAEISDLGTYVETLRQDALQLADIDATTPQDEIRNRLQAFVAAYNGWIDRFDEALASGGLLAGTQAATVAQWELKQSIESVFNGAGSGVRGLGALGISIDPVTNMASLDTAHLASVLAGNLDGAVAAIREFSGNFARSAELLNAEGNFIPNRMDNLARVIDYLDKNMAALQAEFGLGGAAQPSADVARALAAYYAMHKPAA
ncbi:MAG: flagellar filament capping protein FliD [Burkholderiaceae bacterium]|jgi:hypothetical protein|nr:flagellar filament capping protein FliD [Burkholderiaceae bacterium]